MTLAEQIQIVEDNLKEYGVCDITIEEFNYLKDELYSSGCLAGIELGKLDGAREFAEWLCDYYIVSTPIGIRMWANDLIAEWQKGAENVR